ncbi:hypothetical protein Tco_1402270 [Tanacetum coccineum]
MWVDSSCNSDGANLYGAHATGAAPRTKSIWNSTCHIGGNLSKSSGKTSGKSRIVGTSSIITEYLVNISKRRAFWSLNKDILKITILTTNTPYPSRKIQRICAALTKDHKGNKINTPYPEKTNMPYWRYSM